MPTRLKPSSDIFYHVFNRGVEKRSIFKDDRDRIRFINGLYYFNDTGQVTATMADTIFPILDRRDTLVEIHAYCLMRNHFHLLLRAVSEKEIGISEFMKKLGTGYTNYFNKRHERVGSLFQGTYKAVPIIDEAHLYFLPHYIHLNPLTDSSDKNRSLTSVTTYKWSSYNDYTNNPQFPGIVTTLFFSTLLGGAANIVRETEEFAQQKRESLLEQLSSVLGTEV